MKIYSNMGAPKKHFPLEKENEWGPKLYALARKRMSIKSIAGTFGLTYTAVSNQPDAMRYVREGWANCDEEIMDLMLEQARAQPELYDESERNQVRALKHSAIKHLHQYINQTPPSMTAEDQEGSVEDMSTEQIKAKIDSLLKELK